VTGALGFAAALGDWGVSILGGFGIRRKGKGVCVRGGLG
jgi:hypothetical protein